MLHEEPQNGCSIQFRVTPPEHSRKCGTKWKVSNSLFPILQRDSSVG